MSAHTRKVKTYSMTDQKLNTLDDVLGPSQFFVLVQIVNGAVIMGKSQRYVEAQKEKKRLDTCKANNETLVINDNSIDPHTVSMISVVKKGQKPQQVDRKMASVTVDTAQGKVYVVTSSNNSDELISILADGIIWTVRAAIKNGGSIEQVKAKFDSMMAIMWNSIVENEKDNVNEFFHQ